MERYNKKTEELNNIQKKLRKVHFNDDVVIHYIEKVQGALPFFLFIKIIIFLTSSFMPAI